MSWTAIRAGIVPGSFRDPSGFVFRKDGLFLRQVNYVYKENYDHLVKSGLYDKLVLENLLMPHQEIPARNKLSADAYKVLRPQQLSFVSYPYEWCFSQLKEAALLTLQIQKHAFDYGMTLKDSSAYNVQFEGCRPLFIDTLSFEKHESGKPWVAYRQFCEHFIAPLAMMYYQRVGLNKLLQVYLDGIPLDVARSFLPTKSWFNVQMMMHVHLHSLSQRNYSNGAAHPLENRTFSRRSFYALIESLFDAIRGMEWTQRRKGWKEYYSEGVLNQDYVEQKKRIVVSMVEKLKPAKVWDLGANTGLFSRLIANQSGYVVSVDSDPGCVEENYSTAKDALPEKLLPLVVDFVNPSPAIGWENKERVSFLERGPADLVVMLGLLHHLVIGRNIPMERLALLLYGLCNDLIIEFISETDISVDQLLRFRKPESIRYDKETFEFTFKHHFAIHDVRRIEGSERVLYSMRRKAG